MGFPMRQIRLPRRMLRRARRPAYAHNSVSWLRASIALAIRTGDIAVSFTPKTQVVLTNGASVKHAYRSTQALLTAAYAAVQGEPRKQFGAAYTADTALTTSGLALSADVFSGIASATFSDGIKTFAWHVRVAASITQFAYRMFNIDVGPLTGAAGPVQTLDAANIVASFQVISYSPVIDLFILSPQNGGGQMTVVPGGMNSGSGVANLGSVNGIAIRTVDANTFGNFESLNARDLISRLSPTNPIMDEEGYEQDSLSAMADEDEAYIEGAGGVWVPSQSMRDEY